ncbi:MAG: Rne/Rng family ribonuclease [Neisseriaceae bacterium]|nr:MAG: Rne/Rng family ribonuclease [Neisseriaceae bacterium]
MKKMLFNATQAEESRVAIVEGQKLINLDIETFGKEQRKGNIYKGIITKVEPSLEACFVDYGTDRHGFLPFKEIHRSYYKNYQGGRVKIQEVINEGDEVLVQVEKDERGNKGAALTTYISLAGRYLVLMPNNPRGGGVSRRIEGEERVEIKNVLSQMNIPRGMSVIARTAGIGRSVEELQWDLNYQLKLWDAVLEASRQKNVQPLILQESALVIRAIRDHFQPDIGEILIDNTEVYDKVYQFISFVMPQNLSKVKLYQDHIPLFSRFQIENQIDSVYARQVSLPSGGEIVIDHTEALVSIDVNSAKATRGADVEETALQTNLEAAEEISRQMRLRDIGGLVVIDFIDMENPRHQREVETAMRDFLKEDRARVQTTKLSRFGLMEISRQRLQVSLGESTHMICPRCHGTGVIRGIQSSAIHILRVIQEKAMRENTGEVQAQLPIDVATFLLNEKREQIFSLEERLGVPIIIIPNKNLEIPHYHIERVRTDDVVEGIPSYTMVEEVEQEFYESNTQKSKEIEQMQAAVQGITPSVPAPEHVVKTKKCLFTGFTSWLSHFFDSVREEKVKTETNKNSFGQQRVNNHRNTNNSVRRRPIQNKNASNNNGDNKKAEKLPNHHKNDSSTNGRNNRQQKNNQNDNIGKNTSVRGVKKDSEIKKEHNLSHNSSNGKPNNNRKNSDIDKGLKNQVNEQSKGKPLLVKLSESDKNEKNSGSGKKTNAKDSSNTRNNSRKNSRDGIPKASYLESKINFAKLTRYIQRKTNDVLKEGRLSSAKKIIKETLPDEVQVSREQILDVGLEHKPIANNIDTNIVISFEGQEPIVDFKGEYNSNLDFSNGLILVETKQELVEKRAQENIPITRIKKLRRNDVELPSYTERFLAYEMEQVETKQRN